MQLDASEDVFASKAKLKLWMHLMAHWNIAVFPELKTFAEELHICRIFFELLRYSF